MIVYTAKKINIQFPIYLISILSSIISGIILFFMFSDIGLSIFVLGYVIFILTTSELLGKKLYKSWSYYFVIQKILMIVLSISLYYIIGPSGVLLGIGISFLIFSKRIFRVFNERSIDFKIIKSKLGFIVNQYIINLLGIVRVQIDKLLILPMFGFALLGNYSLALQVVMGLTIFPNVIFKFLLPEEAEQKSNKKLKFFAIFISACISICGVVLTPVILPEIFPKYSDAVDAIRIMSLAVIPITLNLIFTSQLLGLEKSKFVLIGRLIALFTTSVLTITLGMSYGMIGLAIAFLLTSIVQTSVSAYANYHMKKDEESLST